MASDWLAALLVANQKLHLKILVIYPCFYPRIALVALIPGRHSTDYNNVHKIYIVLVLPYRNIILSMVYYNIALTKLKIMMLCFSITVVPQDFVLHIMGLNLEPTYVPRPSNAMSSADTVLTSRLDRIVWIKIHFDDDISLIPMKLCTLLGMNTVIIICAFSQYCDLHWTWNKIKLFIRTGTRFVIEKMHFV